MADYDTSARIKLNEVCSVLGLPGKFGADGSKVAAMIDNVEVEVVRDYCETNALNTYLAYLRHMPPGQYDHRCPQPRHHPH